MEFPPKTAFYSKLKQENVNDDEYEMSKRLYDTRRQLADTNVDQWNNFGDYLRYYNLLDTRPLVEALKICFSKFKEFFGVDPGTKLSLPGIAFRAKYNMFDQTLPYVVTFSKAADRLTGFSPGDHIRQLFRNSDGGITSCYHR